MFVSFESFYFPCLNFWNWFTLFGQNNGLFHYACPNYFNIPRLIDHVWYPLLSLHQPLSTTLICVKGYGLWHGISLTNWLVTIYIKYNPLTICPLIDKKHDRKIILVAFYCKTLPSTTWTNKKTLRWKHINFGMRFENPPC